MPHTTHGTIATPSHHQKQSSFPCFLYHAPTKATPQPHNSLHISHLPFWIMTPRGSGFNRFDILDAS
nr:MAG TPA: hypothetical protein [Caudoviricetes sp.]